MGKIKDLLLDVNYMKQYTRGAARIVTVDVSRFGMTDEQRMQDAAMARFQLDQLLRKEYELIQKWAQFMVHDFTSDSVVFRGTENECCEWMKEHEVEYPDCELYWALPGDLQWNWNRYFNEVRERCGLEIEFMW